MTAGRLVFLLATGCYTELGLGDGIVAGPNFATGHEWVFTFSVGADFSRACHRVLVGTSVEQTGAAKVRPLSIGATVGGDVRVAGSDEHQLRLSGRLTVAHPYLSWVETEDGSEFGYAVPLYLGVSWTFACNANHWCAHAGGGVDIVGFHRARDGVGWGAFVGPQLRISVTGGLSSFRRTNSAKY